MNIHDMYPSKYLKAADLPEPRVFTMGSIGYQEIGDEQEKKPCLYFTEDKRGLILNRVNANMIASLYGPDTDGWTGKQIVLGAENVPFKGQIVPALRVQGRLPTSSHKGGQADPTVEQNTQDRDDLDDDIPF